MSGFHSVLAAGCASAVVLSAAAQGVLCVPYAGEVSFEALERPDGAVVVRWTASAEEDVDSYRVLRLEGAGARVFSVAASAEAEGAGACYSRVDPKARGSQRLRYELYGVGRSGADARFATWEGVPRCESAVALASQVMATALAAAAPVRAPCVGAAPRVRPWTRAQPADRIRLGVRAEGAYGVPVGELAAAMGVEAGELAAALATTNVAVSCGGRPVAWTAAQGQLFFYGTPSRHAPENVYWVQWGPGSAMSAAQEAPGGPETNRWFSDTCLLGGTNDVSYLTMGTLTNVPTYLAFKLLTAGKEHSVTAALTDAASGAVSGQVSVVLLSACELGSDVHTARVSVAGVAVGHPSWSGEQCLSFAYPVPGAALTGETAVVRVENLSSSGTAARFFWCRLGLTYTRACRARNDALLYAGGAEGWAEVQGFTSGTVSVWDVTQPERPELVPAEVMALTNAAGWSAVFPCGWSGRRYAVFAPGGGALRPSVRGVCDADGTAADNRAEYVVLIPPEGWVEGFREAVRPLVDFRARQGLRTAIIDVEALYNRFSQGLADPQAIRAFCAACQAGPDVRLRYLLLAGSGSVDFAHERAAATDYNACLIPPLLASQRFLTGEAMVAAVDQAYGDVSGDAAPEVAVGRLPTARTQELAVAVGKTLAYEELAAWKVRAALSSDWDYTADSDCVAVALAAQGKAAQTFYPPASDSALQAVWSNELEPELRQGDGLFWFIGHSSTQVLGLNTFSPLMKNSFLQAVVWPRPPVAVLMGCHVNRWHSPQATSAGATSLAPFGVFLPGSGFAAAFASTGYVADGTVGASGECQKLALFLGESGASNGVLRLGDAVCSALRRLAVYDPPPDPATPYDDPPPIAPERLQSFCLTGDPALVWRHDRSGTGTRVSWLAQYGLTAWDGDVSDGDLDGWCAWQEHRQGTRPDTNCLAVTAVRVDAGGAWADIGFEAVSNACYSVLWKPALTGTDDWQAVSWAWPGQTAQPKQAGEPIWAEAPVTAVCVPVRVGDAQGFYLVRRIE